MIVERCKANGCHIEHVSDGTIRLFEYKTVARCTQCGATGSTKEIEGECTHECDVCGQPLDVFEDAVKFSCRGAVSNIDEAVIEVHPQCVVNAGSALMKKYVDRRMEGIERGAKKPKWWDGVRRLLGQGPGSSE